MPTHVFTNISIITFRALCSKDNASGLQMVKNISLNCYILPFTRSENNTRYLLFSNKQICLLTNCLLSLKSTWITIIDISLCQWHISCKHDIFAFLNVLPINSSIVFLTIQSLLKNLVSQSLAIYYLFVNIYLFVR